VIRRANPCGKADLGNESVEWVESVAGTGLPRLFIPIQVARNKYVSHSHATRADRLVTLQVLEYQKRRRPVPAQLVAQHPRLDYARLMSDDDAKPEDLFLCTRVWYRCMCVWVIIYYRVCMELRWMLMACVRRLMGCMT
jgi:hypothetical protein